VRNQRDEKVKSSRELLKLPYFVLAVSLLISIGVTYIFYNSSQAKDRARFEQDVVHLDTTINSKIRTHIAILKSGRGFVETVGEINREKFRLYISSLDIKRNYSAAQGVGYAKRILSYEGEALAQRMEAEGYTNFKIFPQASKYEYITVLYLEPLDERNRRAIGFDMSSEPNRRAALELARDTGEAVATGKVFLVQEDEEDRQPGFLIYMPVYKGDTNPPTVEERRRLLDSYIYSPFRARNFLNDIRNSTGNDDIAITIYDTEATEENILAQSHGNVTAAAGDLFTKTEVNFAGRKWIVEYRALPEFVEKSSSGWTILIFISGLVFSLLLFGMTYLESFARSRSERIALELRESEREKAHLFEKEQKARRLAEDASRAKDEFISVVSHELRTPLNSIAGWTRILQSETLAPDMKQQALEKIEKNLRIQTRLVEELLDFTQVISGKSDLPAKPVEISEVFENAFAEAEKQAEDKGVNISKSNALNGQKVLGDAERLRKALENVICNAVKFTPAEGQINVEIEEKDGAIELRVRDSGQGISPNFLPFIFEGFRQADSSSTRQFGGLGLGLAISRHIFELHGGSIKAESEGVGKGSLFTVKIPVQKRSAKKRETPKHIRIESLRFGSKTRNRKFSVLLF
jgi:Signal transduction histidine kinase